MITSARNELVGTIIEIKTGGVMSDVAVRVDEDVVISANITNESKENLGLKEGSEVLLLVKSSFVILTKQQLRSTARNNIKAVVDEVKKGAVNDEVRLTLGNKTLCSVITNDSVEELNLQKGDTVYAMFKASSVILVAK
jgi:molybdate transport system regulatory protein